MPLVPIADTSLHVDVVGDGPPIVLVAGLGGRGAYWRAQAAALAPAFTVVSFDHRGCGGSLPSPPPYSIEQWADDLDGLMSALNLPEAVLAGHSTGGAICQQFAATRPGRVRGLLLSATWARSDQRFRELFELRRRVLHALGPADYAMLGRLVTDPLPPEDQPAPGLAPAGPTSAKGADGEPPEVTDGRLSALLAWDAGDRLGRIEAPTLIAAAADDLLVPPSLSLPLRQGIAGAAFRRFDSGGHHFPQTRPVPYTSMPAADQRRPRAAPGLQRPSA